MGDLERLIRVSREMQRSGVTALQLEVLLAVYGSPFSTLGDLVRNGKLCGAPSNMCKTVCTLADGRRTEKGKGFIKKHNKHRYRCQELSLTEKGNMLIDRFKKLTGCE